ncbi:urease accessory protein UreD [Rhodococcus aerolatus]
MRTHVEVVGRVGRRPRVQAVGALTARVSTDGVVHLLGAAAGPLGGDEVHVRVVVEPGAVLRVCSVAASVVLPGRERPDSCADWSLEVADAASLVVCPQPTVVTGRARHRTRTRARVAADAALAVLERVQLGRAGEEPGRWTGVLDVDVAGRPRLRHEVALGPGSPTHDRLEHAGALRSLLEVGPAVPAGEWVSADRHAVRLALAGGGALTTELSATLPPGACP